MPRKTKEEAAKTRRGVLDAALTVFSRKGFGRTTLEDIAAEAGVTRGAVYWHFKDKVALFVALAEDVEKETGVDTEELLNTPARHLQDIRDAIVAYLLLFERNERYRTFYEVINYRTEWTEELQEVLEAERREARLIVDSLERDFTQLRERGLVRSDVDARQTAVALVALTTGLIEVWLFDRTLLSISKDAPRMVDEFLNNTAGKEGH